MCPKCNGPTIAKPLFTSFYQHCERCENPNPCKGIALDGAPFAVGDTVYSKRGMFQGKPRVVRAVTLRKMRHIGGQVRETWLCTFADAQGWRECDRYSLTPPDQNVKEAKSA